ncbi:MAG: glutamate 5-kinase, partial [Actinobacteria bacterium]|nr:glutamate 5-kinase [Actinomycetota bacterium]
MASKLAAARIASWSGVRTVIARASASNVLLDAASESVSVGTTFVAHDRRLTARKLWIAFAAQLGGTVLVDDGAHSALTTRGVSLLHAGVVEVRGDFEAGETVEVATRNGDVFARGLV